MENQMTNVAKIRTNARNTIIADNEDYIKYEIYIHRKYATDFEAELSDKEFWTWMSKTEVTIV